VNRGLNSEEGRGMDTNFLVEDLNVLVVGTVRNTSQTLERNIAILEEVLSNFKSTYFFLVESDSDDETPFVLKRLQLSKSNFAFTTFGKLEPEIPSRTQRLAHCRNAYLHFISSTDVGLVSDIVIVVDLDMSLKLLSSSGLESCWLRDDWAACFANQRAPYYDIWSLRHPEWSPNDCTVGEAFFVSQGLTWREARTVSTYSKMIHLRENEPWIEVQSAFGGLGVYKKKFLDGKVYLGENNKGEAISEHLSVHEGIIADGGKLYINPKLINIAWNEHNSELKMRRKIFRFIKIIIIKYFRMRDI